MSAAAQQKQGKVVCHLSPGDFVIPAAVRQSAPPELQQAVISAFQAAGLNPAHYMVPQPAGNHPLHRQLAQAQQPQQQQPPQQQ